MAQRRKSSPTTHDMEPVKDYDLLIEAFYDMVNI